MRWIAIALIASLAWGCSEGVGAEDVPTPTASTSPSPTAPVATATPKPQFGPPTVSPGDLTATAQAELPVTPTMMPAPDDKTPEPEEASPTPLVTPMLPPLVLFAPVEPGGFEPVLEYEYTVPEGWTASTGDDEIMAVHSSGLLKVTLRELHVDRTRLINFAAVTQSMEPSKPADWSHWSQSRSGPVDGGVVYEYLYSGARQGRDFVSLVQWRLWGEVLIEVAIEARADEWANDTKLRNEALLIMSTLTPASDDPLSEIDPLRVLLKARFGFFRSGIYVVDHLGYRQELSCREVFLQLLSDPVYIGGGVWQVHAVGDLGANVWLIYEPEGAIAPAGANTSKC